MELRQLKYFVTVSQTLSFSEAARKLFVTQGTLSQQIKQLEDELGVQLLLRTSHSVALSEAGEELLPLAQKMIDMSKQCRGRIDEVKGIMAGNLRVGVSHSLRHRLASAARIFMRLHSGVKLNIYCKSTTELLSMLRSRQLDLILTFSQRERADDLETTELEQSGLSVVMRKDHALADRKSLEYKDLLGHSLLLPGGGLQSRKSLEQYYRVDTSELNVRAVINDTDVILDILRGSDMLAVMASVDMFDPHFFAAVPLVNFEPLPHMTVCVQRLKGGFRKRSADAFAQLICEND